MRDPRRREGGAVRTFETGATRDTDDGKPDYHGYLSPLVVKRFGEYMQANQVQPDGQLRSGDNWKKGMPLDAYMKSGWRHFHDWWLLHDGYPARTDDTSEALCALLFNVMGYLHTIEEARECESTTGTTSSDS